MAERLDPARIDRELATLPGWRRDGDALCCSYRFADFRAAFAFMQQMAQVAEELRHHPDWRNCYAQVDLRLSTHEAGGLTALDLAFARRAAVLAEAGGGVVVGTR